MFRLSAGSVPLRIWATAIRMIASLEVGGFARMPESAQQNRREEHLMVEFTLKRTTTAPIEAVFDSLTDHRGISNYSKAVRRSTLDREGTPAPNGVGARRRIEAVGPAIVEEIIEYER